jgi:hypothetical protein
MGFKCCRLSMECPLIAAAITGMPVWAPFALLMGLGLVVFGVSIWQLSRRRKSREAALKREAIRPHLTELPQQYQRFPYFTLAMGVPTALQESFEWLQRWAMSGPVRAFTKRYPDGDAFFFDMAIRNIAGRDFRYERIETFAAFRYPGVDFPRFHLQPEYLAMPLLGKLGTLKFTEFPEFSRCYVLSGEEEVRIRGVFVPDVPRSLETLPAKPCSVEGRGQWLLIYRKGAQIEPDELPEFVETTTKIATVLLPSRPTAAQPSH